jgi:teichuronic acid biosynthesis protein TuaE
MSLLLTLGRLCLSAAVIDGMFTGGIFVPTLFGLHVMGYRLLLPICMFIFLILLCRSAFPGRTLGTQGLHVRGFLIFLVAWLAWAWLSLLWVVNLGDALRQIYFILSGMVLIVLLVAWCSSDVWLERMGKIWLLVFTATVAVGVWEATTAQHLPGSGVLLNDEMYAELTARMPSATFGNPNNFAFYLALTIPMALAWWRYRVDGWKAAALGTVVGAALFVMVATRGRLGIVAGMAGIACWFLLPRLTRAARPRKRHWKMLLLSSAVAIPFFFTGTAAKAWDRMVDLRTSLTTERAGDPRRQLQLEVIDVLWRTKGLGVGAGNIETYLAEYPYSQDSGITNPHGWWVEIAGNYGVLTFVGYTLFYLLLVRGLWRAYRRQARRGADRTLLEGALLGLIVFPVVSFGPSSLAGVVFHWFFLGYCLAVLNNHRVRHRTIPDPVHQP